MNQKQELKFLSIYPLTLFAIFTVIFPNLHNTVYCRQLAPTSPVNWNEKQSIEKQITSPDGYSRVPAGQGSFAAFLRTLPLKAGNPPVLDYRGRIWKQAGDSTIAGVIDLHMRGKKLEQCMDVILRLRAEYLLKSGRENEIGFAMPDQSTLKWNDWKHGFRPVRNGGNFPIELTAEPDSSRTNFEHYLREIFYWSGTQAYYFALQHIMPEHAQIGDLIIKRGRRGHAVLIVDMAESAAGERVAIIAQGDTPACELHLLRHKNGSPWFIIAPKSEAPALPIRKKMYWTGLRRF